MTDQSEKARWTADEIIRLAICFCLVGIALTGLAIDFGWPGFGIVVLALLFIAGGMAS